MAPKSTMRVRALPLAQALSARGHELRIVMPPWQLENRAARWMEGDVACEYVPISRFPLFGYLLTSWRLLRSALRGKPDVIHFFKPKALAGLAAWMAWHYQRLGGRVRLVVDEDDWEGYGGWNDAGAYPRLAKALFAWQERWGLIHNDALTVASRALETIALSHGVPPTRIRYLPNGAAERPAEGNLRAKLGLGDAPVVLLYTRFTEFDPERLVLLWQAIRTEIPQARLLIVGTALTNALRERIDQTLAHFPAEEVLRLGWVPLEQVGLCLAIADVAIFPTDDTLINRCKCSVKLTDLLGAGVAVVADAVGQNREYILDGETGLLVPPGDALAMAQRVSALLLNPQRARELGAAARSRMRHHFTWERLAQVALSAYELATPISP